MKTLIAMFLVVCSFAVNANNKPTTIVTPQGVELMGTRCSIDDVLFFAATKDRTHDILVCKTTSTVFFTFGEVNALAANRITWIEVPMNKIQTDYGNTGDYYHEVVQVLDRSKGLWNSVGIKYNSKTETASVLYRVAGKDTKPIEIYLDPNTMISGIRTNLYK